MLLTTVYLERLTDNKDVRSEPQLLPQLLL